MKNNAIVRIVIWSIVILLLLGLLISAIGAFAYTNNLLNYSRNDTVELQEDNSGNHVLPSGTEITVSADEIRDLNIEWVAGTIEIRPDDVENITFSETEVSDSKYALVWKQKGSDLSIQFCKDSTIDFSFGITVNNVVEKDLTITVPRDWICDSLDIDAASTNLIVSDLTIREVDFDGASSTYEFENCIVDSFDMDGASCDMDFSGTLYELDFDGASGSIRAVLNNIPSRIDMDGMSSDLDITLPENAGFTVSMSAMSSDFSSDFETVSKNGNYVCGDGRCRINVDAMSGDVTIRKQAGLVSENLVPAETASATAHHFHTDECTTDPDSCPDSTSETHHDEHD